MKVRVIFDLNLNGDSSEFHPNYAARLVDAGVRRIAETNNAIVSWETIDAQEVPNEVR